jgi:EAL domain-containing protein (putative c-di-GMP-specific phosphodiesterase class I)
MDMRPPPGVREVIVPAPALAALPHFSYAFQPIVDTVTRRIYSNEALIRGPADEPAYQVLGSVPASRKYEFDQLSRAGAIALAARIGFEGRLNLNFLPQSTPASALAVRQTAEAAQRHGIALSRIVLEVTEEEAIEDPASLAALLNEYRGQGMLVAIDDFGAGYSGLNLLAEFQPDSIKIDMKLVRGIECHGPRQAIVRAINQACGDLGIDVIAEGVETLPEYEWFEEQGVRYFQGYLFAKPGFEHFPVVRFPDPT